MNNDIEKVLYSQDQLNKRMDEMADELNNKYEGQEPIVIPVLNGAMIFASDMYIISEKFMFLYSKYIIIIGIIIDNK